MTAADIISQLQGDTEPADAAPEFVHGQRIAAVCYGEGTGGRLENSTHIVMLDARGYPIDRLPLPQVCRVL